MRKLLSLLIVTTATFSLLQASHASQTSSLYCSAKNVSANLFLKLTESDSRISGSYALTTSKDGRDIVESYNSVESKNGVYVLDNNTDYSLLLKKSNKKWVALIDLKGPNINFTLVCE